MHRLPPETSPRIALRPPHRSSSVAGFSLIEVTLAIGIIAFAFVALFGLLPTGMLTFRAAIDSTNDITMMQEMNAMVQVTSWDKVDGLDFQRGGDIYYFDEEGRRTDSKLEPSDDIAIKARRLYQVKLLVENAYQPGDISETKKLKDARRFVVIIGDLVRPKSKTDFEAIADSDELAKNGKALDVRSRTFFITRLDAE